MSVEITTTPIEVVINGTTVWFQGDPSATPAWDTLLELPTGYSQKEHATTLVRYVAALSELTNSPDDAETLQKLVGPEVGVATLQKVAMGYIQEVTGFPTQPAAGSGRGGKKTTNT